MAIPMIPAIKSMLPAAKAGCFYYWMIPVIDMGVYFKLKRCYPPIAIAVAHQPLGAQKVIFKSHRQLTSRIPQHELDLLEKWCVTGLSEGLLVTSISVEEATALKLMAVEYDRA